MRRARDPVLAFGVWAPSSTLGLRQRSRFPYGHTASLPPGPSRGLREASCVRHGLIPACPEPQAATWGNLSSGSKTQLERQLLRPAFPISHVPSPACWLRQASSAGTQAMTHIEEAWPVMEVSRTACVLLLCLKVLSSLPNKSFVILWHSSRISVTLCLTDQ